MGSREWEVGNGKSGMGSREWEVGNGKSGMGNKNPITHHPSPITHHPLPITHYLDNVGKSLIGCDSAGAKEGCGKC
jgi:hypothetical protein